MEHPPEDTLLRFLLNATTRPENQQIVRHLLARCSSCAATLRKHLRELPRLQPITEDAYDAALDRFAARLRELTRLPHPAPPPLFPWPHIRVWPDDEEEDPRLASAISARSIPRPASG